MLRAKTILNSNMMQGALVNDFRSIHVMQLRQLMAAPVPGIKKKPYENASNHEACGDNFSLCGFESKEVEAVIYPDFLNQKTLKAV